MEAEPEEDDTPKSSGYCGGYKNARALPFQRLPELPSSELDAESRRPSWAWWQLETEQRELEFELF